MKLRKLPQAFHTAEIDGELVILHGGTGQFFAVKGVGLRVWQAIDADGDLDRLCNALQGEYSVGPEECRASVMAFAEQLVEAGFAEYC